MPDIEKLIQIKVDRLESIPDELLSRLDKVQKQVFPEVLELLNLVERDKGGFIILSDKNIQLLSVIQGQLRDVLLGSEYIQVVDEFVSEFEVQAGVSNALFKETFKDFISDGKASKLVTLAQARATKIFVDGIADAAFADQIYNHLDLAIANSASYAETVREIQGLVLGDSEQDGKILQYAKQIAHDQFALSDRSYTSAVSEELEAEWFLYAGSVISTSREFCVERHNHYYYYKEIQNWASEDWDGKIPGTNAQTIFTTLAGFNCRHSLIPVSISSVPKKDILRAMNEGLFTPSEFEIQELGL